MEKKRILCLDLDGTVRRSKSGKTFIEGPDDVELIPGVLPIVKHFSTLGYIIAGVSNQAGIAHGFKTHQVVLEEMEYTSFLMKDGNNKPLFHSIKYCPYDSKGRMIGYNFRSLSRKPDYGMLVLLEDTLLRSGITPDWDNSLFVGDRPEDEECAKRAGIPFMHIDEFLKQSV